MTSSQVFPSFARQLRRALHHLYDPGELRRSPLMRLLGLEPQGGASALRRILLDGIEALKPHPGTPPDAKGWRIYRALYHRYGEQFAPQQVARALGLSERQLRRQETLALRVLAEYLSSHYDLKLGAAGAEAEPVPPGSEAQAPSREQELRYLERSLTSEAVEVEEVVQAALRIAEPLRQALGVRMYGTLPQQLPRLAGPGASLRQALLNTLTAAIRAVPGGEVRITAQSDCHQVYIHIQPTGGPTASHSSDGYSESLEMARQLLALSGASLELASEPGGPFAVRLVLPAAEQAVVLVVDDNADTLQLFQRYLLGTRHPFVGTRDPEQAVALARELRPQVVLLDVMLPGVDGWELLGRLREHPATARIPVIVCTILAEQELALALGAAAFLRKPVSRADLLAALDRQIPPPAPGPCG